jgi:hypothetical protein
MATKPHDMTDQEWAERREEFSFHPDIISAAPLPRRSGTGETRTARALLDKRADGASYRTD